MLLIRNSIFLFLFTIINAEAQQPKLMRPVGHTDGVSFVDYSPDGKYIVTASSSSSDRVAKVWEIASGKIVFNLKGHEIKIQKLAYSPDGKYILTLAGFLYLWDAATGHQTVIADSIIADDVLFSPDGRHIAYAPDRIDSVYIWDIETRKITRRLPGKGQKFDKLVYSRDGKKLFGFSFYVADAEDQSKFFVWDTQSGAVIFEGSCQNSTDGDAVFFKDGKRMVFCSDKDLRIINFETKETIKPDEFSSTKNELPIITPDQKRLIVVTDYRYIVVWNLDSNKTEHEMNWHENYIVDMLLMPDDKKLLSIDAEANLIEWDLESGKPRLQLKTHYNNANGMALSPDGKMIAVTSAENNVVLLRSQTYTLVQNLFGSTAYISNIFFSPDGEKIVTVERSSLIKITDKTTGKVEKILFDEKGRIDKLIFNPDGNRIITTGYDSTLKAWDITAGKLLYTLRATKFHFYDAVIHPSGDTYITWEALDDILSVRTMETGTVKFTHKITTNYSGDAIAYTPDGKWLMFNEGGNLQVRDGKTGHLVKKMTGSGNPITHICISKDSKRVAAVADSIIMVWDIPTGKKLLHQKTSVVSYYADKYTELPSFVNVHFNDDGRKIIAPSEDGTAKIYDVQANKLDMLLDSTFYYNSLSDAYYTTDGKRIITISKPMGFIGQWDAETITPLVFMGASDESIRGVAVAPDEKRIVSVAENDLNAYDLLSGKLLYKTILIGDYDWLTIDTADRYDGTEAARKLLYFTCGKEIIELDQVKDQLWVPDLTERINNGDTIHSKTLKDINICDLTPLVNDTIATGEAYQFHIMPRKGGLGDIILVVNGIEVKRYKPEELTKDASRFRLHVNKSDLTDYFIPGQDNKVTIKALTADNAISSRGLIVSEDKTKQSAIPPNLFAVIVGVSDYKGDELDLKYAAKDAADISNALAASAKKLLNTDGKEHVFIYNLTTAKERYQLPEKSSIKKVFEEIGKKATANDILLIFFAGHGVMEGEKKQFYFLTAEASKASAAGAVGEVGISTAELTDWMKPSSIKAQKRILIFDACNSGQAIKDFVKMGADDQNYLAARNDDKAQQVKAIDKLNEKSGLFILSASASNQNAYEMGRYSQGLLTYSLLKAIKQQPDILEEGKYLNVSRWFNAAEKTVTDLSKENGSRQEPQIVTNTNFNIGVVDEEVMAKIILPQEKPLFVASNFQNSDESIADDDLELSKLINLQLNDLATRGKDSKIVYVTATNSPDAYSLSGRYTVKGDKIILTVNIKQNKIIKSKFEVHGAKDKLNDLAAEVTNRAAGMVK
ncbi:MAG: caspase family protein [Chitinophagaceae bacterium]|nr:caspase family protein [Chitinophagaceae bacterium]